MTDLKPSLNSIITNTHSAPPFPDERTFAPKRIDNFLEEALQINISISSLLASLRRFRAPYLSTAPPPRNKLSSTTSSSNTVYFTASDRETFDTETTAQLRSFSALLTSFRQVESVRQETVQLSLQKKYRRPGEALLRWVGVGVDDALRDLPRSAQQEEDEGRARALNTVRESVLWYLSQRLKEAGGLYGEMFEIRVGREREREKSVLWKTGGSRREGHLLKSGPEQGVNGTVKGLGGGGGGGGETEEPFSNARITAKPPDPDPLSTSSATASNPSLRPSYNPAMDLSASEAKQIETTLSPEQLQLFASENSALLSHYSSQLTRVTQAEKSLLEIADLQNQLVGHLDVQAELVGQVVADAADTEGDVSRGNRELKRAGERKSLARRVYWGTVVVCGVCVVWDLIF